VSLNASSGRLKSDHFGIEIWDLGQDLILINQLKSDHFGIEIYEK